MARRGCCRSPGSSAALFSRKCPTCSDARRQARHSQHTALGACSPHMKLSTTVCSTLCAAHALCAGQARTDNGKCSQSEPQRAIHTGLCEAALGMAGHLLGTDAMACLVVDRCLIKCARSLELGLRPGPEGAPHLGDVCVAHLALPTGVALASEMCPMANGLRPALPAKGHARS